MMRKKHWTMKEEHKPHSTVVGTALVEFAIGRVSKGSRAVGFIARCPVTATIDKIE